MSDRTLTAPSLRPKPETPLDTPCSESDVLQYVLEVESSRQSLERYATELTRLAENSISATQEAQVLARQKGDLLATVSHEIRTPLNGILGMTGILLSRSLDVTDRRYVEIIKHTGETLLSLLDNVLDLSKMEADRLELESSELDLRLLIEDAVSIVSACAGKKGLLLNIDIAADVPPVILGDSLRLRQILLNLLSNSIKFTEAGSVTVAVQLSASDGAALTLSFSVADTGVGLNRKQQQSLFQPFSQAEASTARQYGGTGLGLAICKRLVELMGGTIGVRSEAGAGSCFWFTIQTKAVGSKTTEVRVRAKNARILLVEDNAVNQKVALLILKKLGYHATVAENGRKAVVAAAEQTYDLIFMDCLMPEMDGLAATCALRSNGISVPIVAMTANAFAQNRQACFEAGMTDYLSKPFREADLKNILKKWLPVEELSCEAAMV